MLVQQEAEVGRRAQRGGDGHDHRASLPSRAIREVGTLLKSADAAGKTLPTLSIDTEIRFRSAAERAAFTRDLAEAVATLGARYHDESAPGGRWSRLVVLAHPRPAPDESGTTAPAAKEAT